jgi:cytochrome b6-f complex iron-sulfur subunit
VTVQERILAIYRRLLAAYPADLREEYGDEMVGVLADLLRDRRPAEQIALLGRAVADLARSAPKERWDAARVTPLAAAATAGAPATVPLGGGGDGPRRTTSPSRRDFLRGALLLVGAGFGASIGGASLAYLWPARGEGFGSLVDIGGDAEVAAAVRASGGTWAVPGARAYLVAYDPADDPAGLYAEVTHGAPFMALYQRCVHLGCRVPWCTSSTRFECPCHKSRYNRWGEWKDGPAPRGLDRFHVTVQEGRVIVDTRTIVTGPPRMGAVLDEPPSGPSCLGV